METESSNTQTSLGKLAITLLVTALCSQALPIGLLLLVGTGVANAIGGGPQNDVWENLGLILTLGSTLLLGLYLRPGWRGIGIGLLGLIGEVCGFLFELLVIKLLPETLFSITIYESLPADSIPYLIYQGLSYVFPIVVGIVAILWFAGKIKSTQEWIGVGVGVVVSVVICIGLATGIGISHIGNTVESMFYFPFLYIWLSAVFFPVLLSRRTDWRGLLIWIAIMLIFTIVIFMVNPNLGLN